MYGYSRSVDKGFEEAITRITDTLKEQGFGVLTEIDVKETLKKKLDVDFRRYIILGACNPPFAHKALCEEIDIGLLLPCNVVVYENEDGGSTVTAIDAERMLSLVDRDDMKALAAEVSARLKKAVDAV